MSTADHLYIFNYNLHTFFNVTNFTFPPPLVILEQWNKTPENTSESCI